jgi:Coenzyme PQQ synthesis protein D (PqqD)
MEMSQVSLASTVSHTQNPVAADVAGETVLMSLERNRCYGLGITGSDIWKRIQSPVRVADLIANLVDEYQAAPGTIERDVLELLTQLADEGLIRVE